MKKIAVFLLTLLCSVVLIACGNDHTHQYRWEHNDTHHWQICSCGSKDNEGEHVGGVATTEKQAVCFVCGTSYGELKGNSSDTPTDIPSDEETEDLSNISTSKPDINTLINVEDYPYLESIGVDRSKPHTAYQILVYSFYDSDGDGYGDLAGVEEKLDYIKDLGADIIWLSPVMEAVSYHAYDVLSFYKIDEKLGTLDDYVSLVNAAHERDMKIVLDMPINHTSPEHEWFRAFLSGNPDFAEFYQERKSGVTYGNSSSMGSAATFYTDDKTGKTYFAAFGKTMPDLNYQSQKLVEAIKDVFEFWVELGADGFRFDAVKHVFDPNEIPAGQDSVQMNNDLFKELGDHVKLMNPDLYLLGENFSGQGEVAAYAKSFDAEFDFESWHKSLGAVSGDDPWGGSDHQIYYDDTIIGCTNELISLNPNWVPTFMTGNHDVNRAGSWICDRVDDDDAALKLYAGMVLLRSGISFIYYGDEHGMYGQNKSGDDFVEDSEIRLPMPFADSTIDLETVFYSTVIDDNGDDAGLLGANILMDWPNYRTTCTYDSENPFVEDKVADPNSLFNTYKSIIAFRKQHSAIYNGTMSTVKDYNGCATIYRMTDGIETLYVAINFSDVSTTLTNVTDGNIGIKFVVGDAEVSNRNNIKMAARSIAVFTTNGSIAEGPKQDQGWYLAGSMNDWNVSAEGYEFESHTTTEVKYTITVEANTAVKIVKNGWSGTVGGYDQVKPDCISSAGIGTDKDGNIVFQNAGTYTLYWDFGANALWIEKN